MKNFTKLLFIALLGLSTLFCEAQQRGDTLILHRNKRGGISFVRFKPDTHRRIVNAKPFLKTVLHAKPDDEFRLIRETKDKLGITTLRFQQYYKGIKVENMEYLVHGKNGIIETINGDFVHVNIPSDPVPKRTRGLKKSLEFCACKRV